MNTEDVSEHGEAVDSAPAGWVGGELVHTGGNIFAREWVHPEQQLRAGYSVNDPSAVSIEKVLLKEEGDETNPRMWHRVEDVLSEPCDGEDDCLETATSLMREMDDG